MHNRSGRVYFPFVNGRCLFKRSMSPLVTMPLLMIDVFIFPGLSYNKRNNTFLNSLRKDDLEAQIELTLKVIERIRVIYY